MKSKGHRCYQILLLGLLLNICFTGLSHGFTSDTLFMDYGNYVNEGICVWNGSECVKAAATDPQGMAASESFLYGDFGLAGIWRWNESAWLKIAETDPQGLAASGTLLYGDFGTSGIWVWDGAAWSKIAEADPLYMAASESFLYADFGTVSRVWSWNGTSWSKLVQLYHGEGMVVPNIEYAPF